MKFKRFLSLLLALTLVLSYVPVGAFATETGDDTPIVSEETPNETPSETPSETPDGDAEIEQIADEPTVKTVATEAELAAALAEGGDIKLETQKMGDMYMPISVSSVLTVPADKTVNLDLNGITVVLNDQYLVNEGTLTVKNGTLAASIFNDTTNGAAIYNKGTLVVDGANVSGVCAAIRTESGKVTINGGTISATEDSGKTATLLRVKGGEVVINGGSFVGCSSTNGNEGCLLFNVSGGSVVVNGGHFSEFAGQTMPVYAEYVTIYAGTFVPGTTDGWSLAHCLEGSLAPGYEVSEAGVVSKIPPQGNDFTGYTSTDGIWGEVWGNASESFVIKVLDASGNVMGTTSLKNIDGIIDGDVNVTWNLKLDAASNTDEYWTMNWTTAPSLTNVPAAVELWVDGAKVSGGDVVMHGPDDLYPVFAAKVDENDKILSYIACDGFDLSNASAKLQSAINAGDHVAILTAGTYAVPTGKDCTITGAVKGVVFDNIGACGMHASVTFNNVTFDYYPNTNYTGLQHAGTMVYNNCTFEGQVFLYGQSETFNNCTFNQNSADAYNVWTYGAKEVAFNECTFNSAGKAVLVYNEGACATELEVVDTDFIASAPVDGDAEGKGKAAIEIDTSLMPSGTVIDVDAATTATNFSDNTLSGSSLWHDKKVDTTNENGGGTTSTVTIAGEVVKEAYAVAVIGETRYSSLQAAIEAVQEGETITLVADIKVTSPAYGQNALNHARAVGFTLDLSGYTLSADTGNSVFRFNLNDSGATSDVTVTIKNGKVVSGANTWCALMAAGIDGAKAVMNLEDLVIENNKGGDFAVKAWANGVVNAKNVTINSSFGGGFYAVGGEIVLDGCVVNQKGLWTAPYNSMAIGVSDGGKMTVNSGSYSSEPTAAEEGNNQGTTHGSWVGGVMDSGGTLIINGGTFSNGNYDEDSLATAARGLIFADTGAKVEINGGTFKALKGIFDVQNNLGDASKQPGVEINGGTYSADPTVGANSNLIKVADGYIIKQNADGTYGLKAEREAWILRNNVPKYYGSLAEAIADAQLNETIILQANVEITEPITIDKNITIGDYGKLTISAVGNGAFHLAGAAQLTVDNVLVNVPVYADHSETGAAVNGQAVTGVATQMSTLVCENNQVTVTNPAWVAKNGTTYYMTINEALTAAQAGDTVVIFAGTYEQGLSVTKDITVIGEGEVNFNGKLSITGNGATVMGLNFSNPTGSAGVVNAKDVLVEDCTVVGSNGFRYCYTSGTVTFKDSTITGATYGIHFDGSEGGNVVIDNCVITGWTSFAGTVEKVTMTGTTFAEGNYNYIRFYQDAEISGCTFNENMAVDVANSVSATVTVTNSTVENGNVEDLFEGKDIINSTVTVDGEKLVRVARVASKYFETVEEAFAAVQNGGTIELYADVTMQEAYDVNNFELNIEGTGTLDVNDKLTVSGESVLNISAPMDGDVILNNGAILKDSTISGNVFVAGKVIFRGDNTVAMLYDYGTLTDYYGTVANMEWSVEPGASLTMTNEARYGLGYGDKVTIKGELTDAMTARDTLNKEDASFFTHGLVAQESAGWNCDSSLTVEDAYVIIGSNNSFGNKPGNYGGAYTFNFENVVLDASRITFYEALSTTEFNMTDTDAKIGQFMIRDKDSVFTLTDSKLLSTSTVNGNDEGNYIAGKLVLANSELTYSCAMVMEDGTIVMDLNSSITAPAIKGAGKIVIDATGFNGAAAKLVAADLSEFTGEVEVIGAAYKVTDDGIVIEGAVASIGDAMYATLAEAIANVKNGETIELLAAIDEDVTVVQAPDVKITIDGKGNTFSGTITVDGKSAAYATAGLTIQNVKFDATDISKDASINLGGSDATRYTSNVSVIDCSFAGEGQAKVGIKSYTGGCKNLSVIGCSAIGMHSLMQLYKTTGLVINNCTVTESKNGISVRSSEGTITNCTIDVDGYGVRADGDSVSALTVSGNTIDAAKPVIVRNTTADGYKLAVEGNTLTAPDGEYQVIITKGNDDEAPVDPACKFVFEGNTDDLSVYPCDLYVAEIDGKGYMTLEEAIAAGGEVTLLADVALDKTVKVKGNVVLNLNGKNIVGTDNATGNFALIEIQPGADLTINGEGTITLTAANDRDFNSYSSVISNQRGKLTVNGGTIEHLGGTDMAYGIDNLTNGKGTYAETIINGGTIKSTYRGIRQFLNGVEAQNILTINGGTIEGANKSVWMQDPSKNANSGSLTIGENAKLYGDVYLSVTAGSTEWPVELAINAAALQSGEIITGNVPAGYELVTTDGVVGVKYGVAKVGETYYANLDEVFADSSLSGEVTVELLKDATAYNRVNVSYAKDVKYNFVTSVEGGVVMNFAYDSNWNLLPHFTLGENITLNTKYLQVIGGDIEIAGTLNTDYLYLYGTGEGVTITETGVVNATTGDATVQVKGGTVLTVNGMLNTNTLNVWTQDSNASTLKVSGSNAKVTASHIHAWNGGSATDSQKIIVENGASLTASNLQADRNSEITVDDAKVAADKISLGYDNNVGKLNVVNNGEIELTNNGKLVVSANSEVALDETAKTNLVAAVINTDGIETQYTSFDEAVSALDEGYTLKLLADLEMAKTLSISKSITIDGDGKIITQSADCNNKWALLYFENAGDVTVKNVTFDGIKGGAVIRTLNANMTIDNVVFQNCEHTQIQGLVRLTQGVAKVTNSKFLSNNCSMGISFNYDTDGLAGDTLTIDNCVFEGNNATSTAIVYYVKGDGCTITNSEFIDNTVNTTGNAATVYLGFVDDAILVNGNLFKNNSVTATSNRSAGAIMAGGSNTTITGNAFDGNSSSAPGQDVCASTFYNAIDLSGNYWNDDPNTSDSIYNEYGYNPVEIKNYFESYTFENGVLTLGDEVIPVYVAAIGEFQYTSLQAAIDAADAGETVKVLDDLVLENALTVAADDKITLDLNSFTVSRTQSAVTGNDQLLLNNGDLTIIGNGAMVYTYTGAKVAYSVSTIINRPGSKLTVNEATIANATAGDNGSYAYAIDSQTNGNAGAIEVTINEGATVTSNYMGIRQFINSDTDNNTLTVNGGYIYGGKRAINVHNKYNDTCMLNIGGGEIEGGDYSVCAISDSQNIAITGGEFKGSLYFGNTAPISGGTFDEAVYEGWCAEGYVPTQNSDGTYGVMLGENAVAAIGDLKFASLKEAVDMAADGDVITLQVDHTITSTVIIDKAVTVDLNGKTLTSVGAVNPAIRVLADVVVENGSVVGEQGYCFIVGSSTGTGNLTIKSGNYRAQTTVASVTKGYLTIEGGYFVVDPYNGAGYANYNFLLNCIDANYKSGEAGISVKGGSFENFNPANNAAEGTGTNFVDPLYYSSTVNGSVWNVTAYGAGEIPENPIYIEWIWNDEYTEATATVSVPANATYYFAAYGMNGTVLTVNGEELEYVPGFMFYTPATFEITNGDAAEATYELKISYPIGSQNNPAELVIGDNTADIEAGNDQGYFFTYTAPADGVLTITMPEGGWTYVINNLTSGQYGDMQWSDSDPVVNPAIVEFAAGDELQIIVSTYDPADMWNVPVGDLTFNVAEGYPVGHEMNPIFLFAQENDVTQSGETWYQGYFSGMIMTVEGQGDFSVIYNGVTTAAVDGKVEMAVASANPRMPVIFAVVGDGEFGIDFTYPVGNMSNPAELVIGDNTASIEAGNNQGYFFGWTAEEDGTLIITMPEGDWMYTINNLTSGQYGDTQWSDSDPVVNPVAVEVAAGDEIQVMVNSYDPADMWNNPAADITFTAEFNNANNLFFVEWNWNEAQTEATANVTVPAGATLYYGAYGMNGTVLTVNGEELEYVPGFMFYTPASFEITNGDAAEATYELKISYPIGSQNNPAELVIGDNTADIEAGNDQGYFFTYTAPADGVLTITMPEGGWTYVINNLTSGQYGDMQWSDSDPVVNPAIVEFAAGDELQIIVSTYDPADMWNVPVGDLTFNVAEGYPVGHEMNPIFLFAQENDVTQSGETWYQGYFSGMIMTVEGQGDFSVIYNGVTTAAVDGKVEMAVASANPRMPVIFAVVGDGEFGIDFTYPVGNMSNPAELVIGDNTASIEAGNNQGYFFGWTAEEDGTLIITMPEGDWMYTINNLTSGQYGDTQWSDSDLVVNPAIVEVAAGDEMQIIVSTYDPADPWNAPAGELTFNAAFMVPVAKNEATGETFGSVSEALMAAAPGETVKLMANTEEDLVYVRANRTLDLNGFTITANDVATVNGANIVDNSAANTGLLVVNSDNVIISSTNAQLPVWNGTGYIFTDVDFSRARVKDVTEDSFFFAFQPAFNAAAKALIQDGGENNDISIEVRVSWNTDQGREYRNLVFNESQIVTAISNPDGAFTLTFSGFSALEIEGDITVEAIVKSGTGASAVSSAMTVPIN